MGFVFIQYLGLFRTVSIDKVMQGNSRRSGEQVDKLDAKKLARIQASIQRG